MLYDKTHSMFVVYNGENIVMFLFAMDWTLEPFSSVQKFWGIFQTQNLREKLLIEVKLQQWKVYPHDVHEW